MFDWQQGRHSDMQENWHNRDATTLQDIAKNKNKKSAYILRLHSNVLTELLHALWTHHIVTTYLF